MFYYDTRKLHSLSNQLVRTETPSCRSCVMIHPSMLSSSTSEQAAEEALPEVDNSVYRATRRRCEGGMFLSSSPCCIPPWRTPTRIIESHYDICLVSVTGLTMNERGSHVVCCIGVIIHAPEECGSRVLAYVLQNQVTATRVLIDQSRDIVDEASDDDQRPLQRLLSDYITK